MEFLKNLFKHASESSENGELPDEIKEQLESEELDEKLLGKDPKLSELEALIDLEEFVIGAYTNQMALLYLLTNKGIITFEEFLEEKHRMRENPEIRKLYDGLEDKRKILLED